MVNKDFRKLAMRLVRHDLWDNDLWKKDVAEVIWRKKISRSALSPIEPL